MSDKLKVAIIGCGNIANGAQIIVGTNCIRKSLSEALNEINA